MLVYSWGKKTKFLPHRGVLCYGAKIRPLYKEVRPGLKHELVEIYWKQELDGLIYEDKKKQRKTIITNTTLHIDDFSIDFSPAEITSYILKYLKEQEDEVLRTEDMISQTDPIERGLIWYCLGMHYAMEGSDTIYNEKEMYENNGEKAIELLEKSSFNGCKYADYALVTYYMERRMPEKAIEYYLKNADGLKKNSSTFFIDNRRQALGRHIHEYLDNLEAIIITYFGTKQTPIIMEYIGKKFES